MKIYEKEDFKKFKKTKDGYLIIPRGDYSNIIAFPDKCLFKHKIRASQNTVYGERCIFKKKQTFLNDNIFKDRCVFMKKCYFGFHNKFYVGCVFKKKCMFAPMNIFDSFCFIFGKCTFGANTIFCGRTKTVINKKSKFDTPYIVTDMDINFVDEVQHLW